MYILTSILVYYINSYFEYFAGGKFVSGYFIKLNEDDVIGSVHELRQ